MKRILFTCSILILFAVSAAAQKTKPWTEWSAKDAEKILNDSAWGQTQTEGETSSQPSSTSAITQTTAGRREDTSTSAAAKVESGEKKDSMAVHYRVRFLSAKPIRAAFVRMIALQGASAEQVTQWRTFVDRDFGDYIVVTITLDGNDKKRMGAATAEINGAGPDVIKTTTYLERKDGKRVALMEYRAPSDVLGAKFVFPRMIDGKPFIDANSGDVRFFTEVGKTIKISKRFKVSEMMYDGKLEF